MGEDVKSLETLEFFEARGTVARLDLKVQANAEPYGIVTRAGATEAEVLAALKDCIRRQARSAGRRGR